MTSTPAATSEMDHLDLAAAHARSEVVAFYWTVLAPDIVNPEREEQGSASV
jgi:hypothetical protein